MSSTRHDDLYRWHRNSHFVPYRGPQCFRFFPRLFWFALGAGAFAMWTRHQERKERVLQTGASSDSRYGCFARYGQQRIQESAHATRAVRSDSSAHDFVCAQPREWHADRMREAGKQAIDAMSEMSESALDFLMANLTAIKAKIAESREEREREKLYLEQRVPSEDWRNRKSPRHFE